MEKHTSLPFYYMKWTLLPWSVKSERYFNPSHYSGGNGWTNYYKLLWEDIPIDTVFCKKQLIYLGYFKAKNTTGEFCFQGDDIVTSRNMSHTEVILQTE